LAEPVFVALEPAQRSAAIDALAALLAPHVDPPDPDTEAPMPAQRGPGAVRGEDPARVDRVRGAR